MPLALRLIPSATFFLAPEPMLTGLLCKVNIKTVLHILQVYGKNRTKMQKDQLPNCISLKTILHPGNAQLLLMPDKGVPLARGLKEGEDTWSVGSGLGQVLHIAF